MLFTAENILLVGSILLFVSIVVGKTGYRFGVPALLLFLVVGMAFGSDGLGFQFHSAQTAQFIGMVALSIILFSVLFQQNDPCHLMQNKHKSVPFPKHGISAQVLWFLL